MLLDGLDGGDLGESEPAQRLDHTGDQLVRHRGPRGDADRAHTGEPCGIQLPRIIDTVGPAAIGQALLRHLHQPHRIRGIRRAYDHHAIGLLGNELDRGLPVGRGIADIRARRHLDPREPTLQRLDGAGRLIHAQRGLREQHQLGRIIEVQRFHIRLVLDQVHMLGRLPHHADGLVVAAVPDVDDLVPLPHEPQHLTVDLADQRAGGIHHMHAAARRLGLDLRGDAVCGEHHRNAGGHGLVGDLVELLHEHRPLRGQILHHVLVVHNLAAHIHRRQSRGTRAFGVGRGSQDGLHGQDRAVHPGAESPRIGQHDAAGLFVRHGSSILTPSYPFRGAAHRPRAGGHARQCGGAERADRRGAPARDTPGRADAGTGNRQYDSER